MYKRLSDSVLNKEDNYILPFFWLKYNHKDSIAEEFDRVEKCGVRSICVEARPYSVFAKEPWFKEMDVIMEEAEKRGFTVWVLDDDHFPTGHCAGEIKNHPELRRWNIIERHIDVCGPMTDASLLVHDPIKPTVMDKSSDEHQLMGIYMYKRDESGTGVSPESIVCLTENVKDDFVYFDIPEGCHRVFFLYKSRAGLRDIYNEYMDFFNPEAIDLYINSVHEAHYKRYSDKFGTVFKGFFSDEPCFGNNQKSGFYAEFGRKYAHFPYSDEVLQLLEEKLGNAERHFYTGVSYRHCLLWKNGNDTYPFMRPHDILGQHIAEYLPKGKDGEPFYRLMRDSYEILKDHPVNVARRAAGKRVALATNPIFPAVATESRIRWAGLSVQDFELYTTYENSCYCKPSLDYYRAILERMQLRGEECVMVGNDVGEDMVAARLGMRVFLLTDCLINKKNEDVSAYPHGGFDELLAFVEGL